MKLLIVRHADPDYSIDSLTPQGHIEAELLSRKLSKLDVKAFYVSILGRAKDTANYTLKKMGRTAKECEWLKEFSGYMIKDGEQRGLWDWRPKDWTCEERFYSDKEWVDVDVMQAGNAKEEYERVCSEFDKLLAEHGYVRDGRTYRVETPNEDTIVLFCHFGVECVLLGHLIGASPMVLWHGFCAAPSSVTTVNTEEREKGIASFRIASFGDVSHLYAGGEEPSFAARFCETYDNFEQRHD